MPEMFFRMAETFSRNPASGFQEFIGELSQLEGPALEGITLSPSEERRAGKNAREEYLRRAAAVGAKEVRNADKLAYLRELVDGLARHMKHRDRYTNLDITLIDTPIDTPAENSFAYTGESCPAAT